MFSVSVTSKGTNPLNTKSLMWRCINAFLFSCRHTKNTSCYHIHDGCLGRSAIYASISDSIPPAYVHMKNHWSGGRDWCMWVSACSGRQCALTHTHTHSSKQTHISIECSTHRSNTSSETIHNWIVHICDYWKWALGRIWESRNAGAPEQQQICHWLKWQIFDVCCLWSCACVRVCWVYYITFCRNAHSTRRMMKMRCTSFAKAKTNKYVRSIWSMCASVLITVRNQYTHPFWLECNQSDGTTLLSTCFSRHVVHARLRTLFFPPPSI